MKIRSLFLANETMWNYLENKTRALNENQQIYLCLQISTLKWVTPTWKYFASYQEEGKWEENSITNWSSYLKSWQAGSSSSSVLGSACFKIFHGNVPKSKGWLVSSKVSSLPAMQESGLTPCCKSQHIFSSLLWKSLECLSCILHNMPCG